MLSRRLSMEQCNDRYSGFQMIVHGDNSGLVVVSASIAPPRSRGPMRNEKPLETPQQA